ncbi:hypothetical protein Tco_0097960 [Tanacetum coccineum]
MNQNHFEHNSNYSGFDQPLQYSINHQEDLNQQRISDVHVIWDKLEESHNKILNMVRSFCEMDDDDDEEYSIPLKDMPQISPSIALAPVSSIMEPEDYLIMGNEEHSIIPEKESNEFIKSSVEDLIPILRESEDTSGSDSESVLPSSNDFYPIFEKKSVTFSNPLFDSNDFTSSDNESLSDEDVLEDCKDSYDSNLDELTFLVTPLSDSNEDECLTPGDDIEFLLHHDPSTPMISVASILEGFTDEPPLEENDYLFDLESKENEWKNILYDDLMSEDKVFDPGIYEKSFSLKFVKLTFEDRHYFPITFVIRIFLPYLTYSVDSSFLLSSRSEDTIFNPGISTFHFSSLKPVAYENPMEVICQGGTSPELVVKQTSLLIQHNENSLKPWFLRYHLSSNQTTRPSILGFEDVPALKLRVPCTVQLRFGSIHTLLVISSFHHFGVHCQPWLCWK